MMDSLRFRLEASGNHTTTQQRNNEYTENHGQILAHALTLPPSNLEIFIVHNPTHSVLDR